ncbi:MAG TPA: sulfur oxidation c-type cytochrome SoxX [Zoogloea sp.]|uniref:sulfur oxidation c-type cytochrome SoxX n=1 Tax=Zoogloea sp. TaxID=49181 RepID=UPI002BDF4517|nr:sulfur oxidation c-type cytochrome SoxX [Zoogloea sp.]HMZ77732.1 sulfur oxidation c-type cytochrome SoxX [Rhodocyclaceae bacterium]HNE17146.1 sulfur oxidation c-type cytochrome SoxX [Rhodocyclaceae bacterium]HNI48183.1 sulfur oxidation c-type cytochrome SoxX [Zoogloea sp.]
MKTFAFTAGLAAILAGAVTAPHAQAADRTASADKTLAAQAEQVFRSGFRRDNPPYWMARIEQDEAMRLCSQYKDDPPDAVRRRIEAAQRATLRYPVDGKLVGDWREGEKLASSGRGGHIGFIQPDPPGTPRGGNCYACHELAKKEVAYGTIGPSLRHFGRLRGGGDDVVRYAYEKIYNSNIFMACTNMPRFGLHSWLTPEQITHLVAFLIDPESPVNKD